jgi:hypothetical protein
MADKKPKCKVCDAPPTLSKLITKRIMEGVPYRVIQEETGIDKNAIMRHKQECIPKNMQIMAHAGAETRDESGEGFKLHDEWLEKYGHIEADLNPLACTVHTAEDYRDIIWAWMLKDSKIYEQSLASGQFSVALRARKAMQDSLLLIGKASGIITDAPVNDNRTITIGSNVTNTDLDRLVSAILGEHPALSPAKPEAIDVESREIPQEPLISNEECGKIET